MTTLLRIAAVFALLAGAAQADQDILKVTSGEYPPYSGSELEDYGTATRVVTAAAKEAGFTPEYSFMPWKRALEDVRNGRYQATSWWAYSEERTEDFIHVGPVLEAPIVFFSLAETEVPDWTELSDLAGLRIGAVPGYTYTAEFWELAANGTLDVQEAPSDEANMRKLLAGRIDLFPVGSQVGWALLRQILSEEELDRVTEDEKPMVLTLGYVLVSRQIDNADELAKRLQAGVDKLRENGELFAKRDDSPG